MSAGMETDATQETPSRLATFLGNWQLHLRVVVCTAIATALLQTQVPHAFWFMKLWCGTAFGTPVAFLWYAMNRLQRPRLTEVIFLTVVGLLAMFCVGSFEFANLRLQESQLSNLRSLTENQIASIAIRVDQRSFQCHDRTAIAEFVEKLPSATLFHASHERATVEFQVTIHLKNGERLDYDGWVPERHPNDFSLRFRGQSGGGEMIVPAGRNWLLAIAPEAAKDC